jgi:hypothetical protein
VTPASALGLAGHALLVAVVAAAVARRWVGDRRVCAALALLAAALSLVPFGALAAVAYLRGVFGDLSVTTVVLLAAALGPLLAGREWVAERERAALLAAVGAAALLLYPLALGLTYVDPYAAGYGSYLLLGALALVSGGAWLARRQLLVAVIALALAAWLAGLLESQNLWDYLLDPLVAGYAWVRWLRGRWRAARAAAATR